MSLKKFPKPEGSNALLFVSTVSVTKGLNLFSQHRDLLFQFAHLSAWKYFLLLAGLLLPVEGLVGGSPSEIHQQALLPGGGSPKQDYSSRDRGCSGGERERSHVKQIADGLISGHMIVTVILLFL